MTPAVMEQKIGEILQLCKNLYRQAKRHPDNLPVNGRTQVDDQGRGSDRRGWATSDRIQLSLCIITVLAVGCSVWANIETMSLVSTSQATYNTANRPYVGISGISVRFMPHNVTKQDQISVFPTAESTHLGFSVEFKNFGIVPGTDFQHDCKTYVGGELFPTKTLPEHPQTIFPGESAFMVLNTDEDSYHSLQEGTKTLVVECSINYKANGKVVDYCNRFQYSPEHLAFMDLGVGCSTWKH